MKTYITLKLGIMLLLMTSCSSFNKIMKSPDTDFKYEVAKQYFFQNKNSNTSFLLDQIMPGLKGQAFTLMRRDFMRQQHCI